MRRKLVALGGAVVVALAACSGSSHQTSPTTLSPTTDSPPPSTAAAINPDVIPPVITAAYVNAVFVVLNHINGDAVRSLVASKKVTPAVEMYLRAIYNDPLYSQEVKIAQQSIAGDLSNVRRPPGDLVTTVDRLISTSKTCVFAETQTDFAQVLVDPSAPAASEYFAMTRKQSGSDPGHLNPTPWSLSFNADYLSPTTIPSQCPGS